MRNVKGHRRNEGLEIIFEDDWLIVVNKPSGLLTMSTDRKGDITAYSMLQDYYTEGRIFIVHRLDRDTSGLLLFAKKRSALSELQALLREGGGDAHGGVGKRYLTLLAGRMPDGTMSVDAPLHVGLRQGGERHVQVNDAGKPSLSHFKVLERRGGHSYCEVAIATGRTHQIRVHARHIGHAVAGDDKYGDPEVNRRLRDKAGLRRLFLHAASLEFALDDGRTPYLLHAPLAPELSEVLDRLAG